jgi:hypothetical protein
MTKSSPGKALELRIMQMYIWALVAPNHINGEPVSLVRHGAYDVRLIELPKNPKKDTVPLWLQLFDHEHSVALDSYGGCDLQEGAAAQALISHARRLHRCTRPVTAALTH